MFFRWIQFGSDKPETAVCPCTDYSSESWFSHSLLIDRSSGCKMKSGYEQLNNVQDSNSCTTYVGQHRGTSILVVVIDMKGLRAAEEIKDCFSNDDIAIEILSRLPAEFLLDCKCVSKRWYALIASPPFITAHLHKFPKNISGIFVQGLDYCDCCQKYLEFDTVDYMSMQRDGKHGRRKSHVLFLPERFSIVASCNGILLCRSIFDKTYSNHWYNRMENGIKDFPKRITLYVCNPLTGKYLTLRPKGTYRNGCCYGFTYNPFGSSSVTSCTSTFTFQLVIIQPPLELGKDPYRFIMYSSKIGRWTRSKEVCSLPHRLYVNHNCFANGVFYWLTTGRSILAFDSKYESSQIIMLPAHEMIPELDRFGLCTPKGYGLCMGVSEGNLHYVRCNMDELSVWVLEHDQSSAGWVLKHSKSIAEISNPLLDRWKKDDPSEYLYHSGCSPIIEPYVLCDNTLFMILWNGMYTYNIRAGKIEDYICDIRNLDPCAYDRRIVIPYSKSLLQVHEKGITSGLQ